MASLICLAASFLFFRIVGLEWGYFADWHHALRAALGAMFLLTASAHWGKRRADLVRMVPERVGGPSTWVSATGVAEIAIAIGLQLPRLAPWTAAIAVVMLCCLFPANLRAARERLTIDHKPVLPAVPRFLIQLVFIAAVIGSVWPRQ
ncbi:MAG TPA: DoxX family protein [Verrucomicrobiae bacterium]|nr:DoxX family protein [Verrucomicrobiae bacterium]